MPPLPGTNQNVRQLFYCHGKIVTEVNGEARWRFLQADNLILAQNNHKTPSLRSTLVACDQQRSVLSMYGGGATESQVYSPYGHHIQGSGLLSLLAFNGERPDVVTGNYHLGNGYRQFSPVMMRFCSPDSWSPFGAGGFNAYAYCAGDPANHTDPTGHRGVKQLIARKQNPGTSNTSLGQQVVKPNVSSKTYIKKRDVSGGVVPRRSQKVGGIVPFESLFKPHEIDEQRRLLAQFSPPENATSKKVYFQSRNEGPDLEAAKRYAQSVAEHKASLEAEINVRGLDSLLTDLDAVNLRISGAGSSRDPMIQTVLQAEITRRTGKAGRV